MNPPKHILPVIVLSQFFCTSLWFAGNGVMHELQTTFLLNENALGHLTSVLQFGFIVGTFLFAILSIADRYAPSKVFFGCAVLGAICNVFLVWKGNTYTSILLFRFFTGFFLAGIYPVGMKIAADYYQKGLGKSLGYLVGALVIGTAFPHLLKEIKGELPWEFVIITTSVLALLGGIVMLFFVPNGPYRKPSQKIDLKAIPTIFKEQKFRKAAFGYFGHMWELYAFWAFVPSMLHLFNKTHTTTFNIPVASFSIIAIGGLACVLGGYISQKIGVKQVAMSSLALSCLCCLLFPLLFSVGSANLFIVFLLFWGMVVIADSPLFSTLVAQNAPSSLKGTALTIVNCIGFFITIISIQLLNTLQTWTNTPIILTVLAFGPLIGLMVLLGKKKTR
ncbi:putative MFS family arabinose efflux permease [Kordia periserrulae]|uniref:Putative MFS family arabinose efflux permease n=1 Tax=Kordia periserrulae TaxID=701523 RepID=A0A2T6BYD3_9FLAO|nr:MFS transporter [Kordia periserrulae]PTX61083.1 putative MFS family arabinose efflux permease [Kordia periserrulae]